MSKNFPEYSTDALLSLSLLFEHLGQLQIYVEDAEQAYLHELIYRRLLDGVIPYENIHPVGGKPRLIDAFTASLAEPEIPRVFIADLDFDRLLGNDLISHPSFIYLDRYCLENYLVDESAAILFVQGRTRKSQDEARSLIAFQNWLREVQLEFKQLIVIFALIQAFRLGIPNVGDSEGRFLEARSWRIDRSKLALYQKEVIRAFRKQGRKRFAREVSNMEARLREVYGDQYWAAIPGKHLLQSLLRYLTGFCKLKQVPVDDFLVLSASTCDLEPLMFVRSRIISMLQAQSGRDSATA